MSYMKEISTGKGSFLFVEVPEGIEKLQVKEYKDGCFLIGFVNGYLKSEKLPTDKWDMLCVSKGISEEGAGKIVDGFTLDKRTGYRDYEHEHISYRFQYQTQSFSSLLKANGLDKDKNYAILLTQ